MYHYYWQIGQNRFELKTNKFQLSILGVWFILLFLAPIIYIYSHQITNPSNSSESTAQAQEQQGEVAGASTSIQALTNPNAKAANITLFIGITTFVISATALYILIVELDKDKRLNPMIDRWRQLQPEQY